MKLLEWLSQPWPWWVAGPLIGLTVPALLIIGNKTFGISSSMRHLCAICLPTKISYFQYDWKKEIWNLFFVVGIIFGGIISSTLLNDPNPVQLNPALVKELHQYGINNYTQLIPIDIFNWQALLSVKGFILMIVGGFLVGFGTRYAGGCTSGHSITGLSNLQWPSLVATICFMVGGFIAANLFLPFILKF